MGNCCSTKKDVDIHRGLISDSKPNMETKPEEPSRSKLEVEPPSKTEPEVMQDVVLEEKVEAVEIVAAQKSSAAGAMESSRQEVETPVPVQPVVEQKSSSAPAPVVVQRSTPQPAAAPVQPVAARPPVVNSQPQVAIPVPASGGSAAARTPSPSRSPLPAGVKVFGYREDSAKKIQEILNEPDEAPRKQRTPRTPSGSIVIYFCVWIAMFVLIAAIRVLLHLEKM
jgi:hypothetical protein